MKNWPYNKELTLLVIAFWLVCFVFGYYFAPEISEIVGIKGRVKAEATTITQYANNIEAMQAEETLRQLSEADLEAMTLESFTDQGDPMVIPNTHPEYIYCNVYEGNDALEISNPEEYLAFINKKHKITYDYTPADLVLLTDYQINTTNPRISMRKEPAEKLDAMYDAMTQAGFKIMVSSGWRSFAQQQRALDSWTRMVGAKNANNYSAYPGYSEHHLGTTVDILTGENGYTVSPGYFNTKTFKWLSENAHKYGFSLSYPQGKQNITGYNPEGWHYRYVGIELATELRNKNITFNEYMYAKYNMCP